MNFLWKNIIATGVLTLIGMCAATAGDESPLSGEIAYTGEFWNVPSGGLQHGSRYLHNVDLSLEWDMSKSGLDGGTIFIYGLANNKSELSADLVGDLQVISNIDNSEVYRLFEAWYEQELFNSRVKMGLVDLNSEFDVIETGALFINSSHGIGPDFSQTGENGPSIFPSTSLAIMLETVITDQIRVLGGVFDAVPNDPNDPSRHKLAINEGALYVAEIEFITTDGIRFALGGYQYSSDFEPVLGGQVEDGNRGMYGIIETSLTENLSGWLRAGVVNSTLNPTSHYIGSGLVLNHPFYGREDDQVGIAIGAAMNGNDFKTLLLSEGSIPADGEYNIEASYRYQINENIAIQPDVQYIINTGGVKDLKNTLVIGLHFDIAFGF